MWIRHTAPSSVLSTCLESHMLLWFSTGCFCAQAERLLEVDKWKHVVAFHSWTRSRILRKMLICSTVPLPGLKPACSFLSLWSTTSCILLIRIFPSTLLAIGSSFTLLSSFQIAVDSLSSDSCSSGPVSTALAVSFPAKSGQRGAWVPRRWFLY